MYHIFVLLAFAVILLPQSISQPTRRRQVYFHPTAEGKGVLALIAISAVLWSPVIFKIFF